MKTVLLYILLTFEVFAVISCRTTESSNDLDGDGVTENDDLCPDTPRDVKVDKNGCPVDTDGDGVPDYQDPSPDKAGTGESLLPSAH